MSDPNDGELAANSQDHVGLVGLGLMGGAMATRLRGGGHTVLGFDTAADPMRSAVRAGVIAASGAVEIARRCRRVLLSLPDSAVVETVVETMTGSRIMDSKGPKMVRGDFTPQARLAQHLKDVRLMLAQADGAGLPMPLSRAHARLLEAAVAAGLGDHDNAAIIQMSYSNLRALFQQSQGETLCAFLRRVRLDQACVLLSDARLSVKDVARRLNFSSEFYFSHFFHRATGFSPSQFRRRATA